MRHPAVAVASPFRFSVNMSLKIASWNVNSIKARQEHVARFLKEKNPDVLFIQELKGETFPEISSDYHVVYVGQKTYNGVAILTHHGEETKIISTRLAGDDTDEQARYLEIEFKGLRLINIYLPNGNPVQEDSDKFPYKLKWMERLYHRLSQLRSEQIPFLVGGDFNVIPDDIDCYNPTAWQGDALFRIETHQAWRALLNLGLSDAYRVLNPLTANAYTFWDYQAGAWPQNHGIRIDHFLLSPPVTDRLLSCWIDPTPRGWDKASDHTPIFIELSEI